MKLVFSTSVISILYKSNSQNIDSKPFDFFAPKSHDYYYQQDKKNFQKN